MLITFLGMPAYEAVGIALASDVLASAVSAYTYGKNKNLDIRNGLVMMITVLLFTMVGSFTASKVPNTTMGSFSVFMTLLLGIKFIVKPVMTTKESMNAVSGSKRMIQSVISGIAVGFICGFIGAGGGMMMLLILTSVLGYELKTAVGTSVFIMAFTALGQDCSKICKQSKCSHLKPCDRYCPCGPWCSNSCRELFGIRNVAGYSSSTGFQAFPKLISLNREARPVICFNRRISSLSIP